MPFAAGWGSRTVGLLTWMDRGAVDGVARAPGKSPESPRADPETWLRSLSGCCTREGDRGRDEPSTARPADASDRPEVGFRARRRLRFCSTRPSTSAGAILFIEGAHPALLCPVPRRVSRRGGRCAPEVIPRVRGSTSHRRTGAEWPARHRCAARRPWTNPRSSVGTGLATRSPRDPPGPFRPSKRSVTRSGSPSRCPSVRSRRPGRGERHRAATGSPTRGGSTPGILAAQGTSTSVTTSMSAGPLAA